MFSSISSFCRRALGEMPRTVEFASDSPPESALKLSERLIHHINAHQVLLEITAHYSLSADVTAESRILAAEADQLARALAAIPNADEFPVLARAQNALKTYWRFSWTNGGVGESEYSASLRSAAAFLKRGVGVSPMSVPSVEYASGE